MKIRAYEAITLPPAFHHRRYFGADNSIDTSYLITYLPGYFSQQVNLGSGNFRLGKIIAGLWHGKNGLDLGFCSKYIELI
jgi:hypothetical protein